MNTPSAIRLFGAFLLLAKPAVAGSICDPSLVDGARGPLAYRLRGDRCEGMYAQQVSALTLEIRSFTAGFGPFDPARDAELALAWTAPPRSAQHVRLRAFSFKPRVHYRMDAAVPAVRGSYRWTTDVLAAVGLGREDLGLLAWIDLAELGSSSRRQIYLPLRAGRAATSGYDGYEVSLVPSTRLSKVQVTVSRLDARGNAAATLRRNQELGYGYYPAAEPTVFTTGKLGPAGIYHLQVTALSTSGLSIEQDFDFYHPGD